MKRRLLSLVFIGVLSASMLIGCGGKKNNDSEQSNKKPDKTETEVVEVVEGATSSENEDGSITVNTDTGEQIVITDTATKTENADGSVTYETEDGKKIEISADGQTTVKTETTRPVEPESQTPSQPNHSHSYAASVTQQATCSQAGVKTFTCSCGSSYTQEIAKANHNPSDWVVTKNATCKEEGVKVKKCTSCGTQLESTSIAKSGHTPSDWVVTKEATCSTNGSKQKVCTVCSAVTETAVITANGTHNYSWNTNGNTRTMKCGCGATGITEYNYNGAWGYFDDNAAEELLYWVNEQRKATQTTVLDDWGNVIEITTVSPLSKNNDLYAKAKNRAVQAAISFDHAGEQHECLAWGYGTAHEAYVALCASNSHLRAMVDKAYTIGGTACFWYDSDGSGTNLTPIWVLELGF